MPNKCYVDLMYLKYILYCFTAVTYSGAWLPWRAGKQY
jgi:hypothetical protein